MSDGQAPSGPGIWTDALLDQLMIRGDPPADDAAKAHAAEHLELGPRALVGHLAAHISMPPEHRSPSLDRFLSEEPELPDWHDTALMDQSAKFFELYGLEIGLSLFCASLPEGYAAPRGAKVLTLTAELVTDPVRRVYETAQFLMDCMGKGGLERGVGAGYADIRRVRLMHAAVRHLVTTDPEVAHTDERDPIGKAWSSIWGTPLNQEDLLGALMTFTVAVFEALDRMGAKRSRADDAAYLHTWCVVGHLLGIAPELLPLDLDSAYALTAQIRRRNWRESDDGKLLGTALIDVLEATYRFRVLRGLPSALIRWLTPDPVPGIVGAKRRAISVLFGPLRTVLSRVAMTEQHERMLRHITRSASEAVLLDFVRANRAKGARPPFELPEHLNERVRAPRKRFDMTWGRR